MNFYNNYLQLCNFKGETPSRAALNCGISKAAVNRWKNGYSPTDANLQKLADYFGVTTCYLLGRTDQSEIISQNIKISAADNGDGEKNILWNKYTILDDEDRITVNGLIDTLLSKEKYSKKPDQNVG